MMLQIYSKISSPSKALMITLLQLRPSILLEKSTMDGIRLLLLIHSMAQRLSLFMIQQPVILQPRVHNVKEGAGQILIAVMDLLA